MNSAKLVLILTIGVFGILNTEMGFMGLLPLIAQEYGISVAQAGLTVSLFALGIGISAPIMPVLLSGVNRKTMMLVVLGVFLVGNIVSFFTTDFNVLLAARVIPAIFHPIYCSLAFAVAAASVAPEDAPKAVSKVFIGVSAGMVLGVPVSSYLASTFSLAIAMSFFGIVNLITFLATIFMVPSMPVTERKSYGEQLSVLKKPVLWISMIGVILMNASIFGVFSYASDYLNNVSNMSWTVISLVLFVYGLANIPGSVIGGNLLSKMPLKTAVAYPIVLGLLYVIMATLGTNPIMMAAIILVWGVLGGIGAN